MMLLLNPPFGYWADNGAWISLTTDEVFDARQVTKIFRDHSCYPPAIPKIINCLRYSGRYDCILQASWFKHQQASVTRRLMHEGVTLTFRGWLLDLPRGFYYGR